MLSRRQRSLGESRMDIHKNARLTPHGRERLAKMILSGQTPQAASEAAGVCPRTAAKWRDRFEQEGLAGLQVAPPGRFAIEQTEPRIGRWAFAGWPDQSYLPILSSRD